MYAVVYAVVAQITSMLACGAALVAHPYIELFPKFIFCHVQISICSMRSETFSRSSFVSMSSNVLAPALVVVYFL